MFDEFIFAHPLTPFAPASEIKSFIHSTIEQYVREVVGEKADERNCNKLSRDEYLDSENKVLGWNLCRNEILQSSAERGYN